MKNRRLWFVLLVGCVGIGLAGCGQKSNDAASTANERSAFGAPADPNKMSPEQKKMFDQFRQANGNPAASQAPPAPHH